jgi:hypothetical protein
MMNLMNRPATLHTPEKAEALAAEMQSSDDGWTYVARHDPKGTGYSLVDIFDEDGELVGQL